MTTLHVIILAQGQQSRLPDLLIAKHLLEIPHTGEIILKRTLRLVSEIAPTAAITLVAPMSTAAALGRSGYKSVSVDAGDHELIFVDDHRPGAFQEPAWRGRRLIDVFTLRDPGNHAVAGLQRYLRARDFVEDQTVVLLGDVIYSRAALTAILTGTAREADPVFDGVTFVGTPDLTGGGGELFGIRVSGKRRDVLLADLPRSSSAFTAYQPGRLRELLWELQKRNRISWDLRVHRQAPYIPISDFTTDIDTPADLANLPELGKLVAAEVAP
jgi:hypothetical protein